MMTFRQLTVLLLTVAGTVLLAISCSSAGKKYFAFEETEYVNGFRKTEKAGQADTLWDIDAIGITGIKASEDWILLAAVDSGGCLSAYSKDGRTKLKTFLNTGRGGGDVLYRPYISWFDFMKDDNGHILAGIYDFKGNYLEYDVTATVYSGKPEWRIIADSLATGYGARYFKVNDDILIGRKLNTGYTGYERFFVDAYSKAINHCPATEYLNDISALDYNYLSTLFLSNGETIAEVGTSLNVIHLYSLKGDFMKTVAVGKPVNLRTAEPEERGRTYCDAKAYENFIAALHIDTSFENIDTGKAPLPHLHFFSWDGIPLADLSLPVHTMYFDVDIPEKRLYIVENDTEKVMRYDISTIIDAIQAELGHI